MKIKLSKFNWINTSVISGGTLTLLICSFYMGINHYLEERSVYYLLIMMPLMIILILSLGYMVYLNRNYLMIMEIGGTKIRSFLFGRLKCEVDTQKEIYYVLFICNESNSHLESYIAISNERFIYDEKKSTMWKKITFIGSFDTTKLIVFPYNKKTEHLFPIEKWIDVTK